MVAHVSVVPLTPNRPSQDATVPSLGSAPSPQDQDVLAVTGSDPTGDSSVHSIDQAWLHSLYDSLPLRVCSSALQTQYIVLRNATGSIVCAWIATACYALGNVFSGKLSIEQSRSELIVANVIWCTITYSAVLLGSHIPRMLSLRFREHPNCPPTTWFCIKKLVYRSAPYFLITTTLLFALGCLVARLSLLTETFFRCKLDFYLADLCTHTYTTGLSLVVQHIYHCETVPKHEQGKPDQQAEINQAPAPAVPQTRPVSAPIALQPRSSPLAIKVAPYYSPRTFWRAYVKGFPQVLPVAFAGGYVHLLSQQRVLEQSPLHVTCFIIVSTLFKLAIQEGVKHYVVKKQVHSIRFMCVLVGLPTVLIDTQTRTILLRMQDTDFAAIGTLGMAFIEILLRVGKAALVTWYIRHREKAMGRSLQTHRQPSLSDVQLASRSRRISRRSTIAPQLQKSPSFLEFELWCRQLMAFHTAELNADMYAEYIAIGCSASILFFFGNHTHYSLLRVSEEVESGSGGNSRRVRQLYMFLFQIAVEGVVDFVSIVLEMVAGIEFDHIKDLGSFLAALFMITAVLNVNISTTIYLG